MSSQEISIRSGKRAPRPATGLEIAPHAGQRRLLLLAACLLTGVFGLLSCRLFVLQVVRHPESWDRARQMLTGLDPRLGRRGDLLTRDGTLLARDTIRYTLAMDPEVIPASKHDAVIERVCRRMGIADVERREKSLRLQRRRQAAEAGEASPLRYLILAREIEEQAAEEVRGSLSEILTSQEIKGFILDPVHHRDYPRGELLGPVLGATTMASNPSHPSGAGGLELALDAYLAGWDGHRKVICDGLRTTRLFSPGNVDIPAIDGYNAALTIDSRIQGIAEEELDRGLARENAAAGLAVVMDCRRGDILAMVSLPAFDPNRFHQYPEEELVRRRRNRVIEDQYEPGSTLKAFLAAIALEKGLFRPDQVIWEGGSSARFLGRPVTDVRDHGRITFEEAVIYSSNIGMTVVGLKLGAGGLIEALDRFRFQKPTGISLPGEAVGKRTPRRLWSEKYTTISVSFGFEVSITPIQLAAGFCSLVNGGHYFRPRIVDRLFRPGEVMEFPVEELGQPITAETSRALRGILLQVVERGTARAWKIPGFPYGGKTGTAALSRGRQGYHGEEGKDYLSSFIAFAPVDDPEIVVLAMVEKPEKNHYGSTVCGPVVSSILRRIYRVPAAAAPPAPRLAAGR